MWARRHTRKGKTHKNTQTRTRTRDMMVSFKSTFLPCMRKVNKDYNTPQTTIISSHKTNTNNFAANNIPAGKKQPSEYYFPFAN